jgi:hypothetical protein
MEKNERAALAFRLTERWLTQLDDLQSLAEAAETKTEKENWKDVCNALYRLVKRVHKQRDNLIKEPENEIK